MREFPRFHPRSWGVRARVTIAASAVLAIVLSLGTVILIVLVHQSLLAGLDSSATTRAQDVAVLVSTASPPRTLAVHGEESSVVQVIDSTNSVVSSTNNASGEGSILATQPTQRTLQFTTLSQLSVGGNGSFRIAMLPVQLASGPGWVYVATSLSQVDAAIGALSLFLIFGLPALVVFVALTIRFAVGRSLRPVELIRKNALAVSSNLVQRVAVPPSNDEIHRLAVTVNEMLDRLQTAAARERRFVGDASHELRSPLAALRTQVEVALAHGDRLDALEALTNVEAQAVRMTELIDDLLFLAHADESRSIQRFSEVDLDELVVAEVQRIKATTGVEARLVGLDAARISGSPRDLGRMLRNLGDNAARHARSHVTVELRLIDSHALVTVANDGPAVPQADRARVFDRFVRLDDSRTRGPGNGGSGLGLAIAQQIAHDHGGFIAETSAEGATEGAIFTISIPVTATVR